MENETSTVMSLSEQRTLFVSFDASVSSFFVFFFLGSLAFSVESTETRLLN